MSEEKVEKSKFEDIVKKIEELSVKDLAELVKELEERFGVSSMAPMVAGSTGANPQASDEDDKKAEYTIHLKDAGAQKIAVIKAIREIRPDLGLKEAKDLADAAPKDIKENVLAEEAEQAMKKFTEAGATVELK